MSRYLRIIMWVLFLAALFVAIAYFLPGTVVVERSTVIQASPKTVYAQIVDLHQWNKWSRWNQLDTTMKVEYKNYGVGQGAGYSWESQNKNVGSGAIEITKAKPFESIELSLNFMQQGNALSNFVLTSKNDSTLLQWTLSYDVGNNPFARWFGLMMPKYIGADFEYGLTRIKALSQAIEEAQDYVVLLQETQAINYAGIRETVPFIEISLKMGEMYGEISGFLASKQLEMTGMPFAMYHLMNEEDIDLECGIPIAEVVEGNNKVMTASLPALTCATVDYYGDYTNLQDGHAAIQKWMEAHGFALSGAPLEFYITDPGQEPDPEKWLTRICYPVEQ
ncbi:SRPBCC family protein [uncultured Draconibacterium sp.]|uniref:SRPBCC family protein n=1 Tax=uncultured Draconibacterium sp. TaxID=1573823 RepID=UPI0025CE6EE5|nr:SRPBCC family protein [uncultured Draconibacterium sp.]